MANGPVHRAVGVVAGGAVAWHRAAGQRPVAVAAELAGGAVGGLVGARLPDIIDPPTHPRHRSIGHGIVPVIAGGVVTWRRLDGWQSSLRARAQSHAARREVATSVWGRAWHWLAEVLCRFASGFVAGLLGGYLSHVALDAMTPAGLPLLA